jgi:NADH-quinone oxidoreductase subunit K
MYRDPAKAMELKDVKPGFGIFINRKNVIIILMSVELILLAVNLNLVAFSFYLNDLAGQIFALFI